VPRDSLFNMLDNSHPLLVFIWRNGIYYEHCVDTYGEIGFFFTRPDDGNNPKYYLKPIALSWYYNYEFIVAFHQVDNLQDIHDKTMTGLDENKIVKLSWPLMWHNHDSVDSCHTYFKIAGVGSSGTLPATDPGAGYMSYGNTHWVRENLGRSCYTPTGVEPYCTLIDADYWACDYTGPMTYFFTATKFYQQGATAQENGILNVADSTSYLSYPNGNATHQAKYVLVFADYYYDGNTPSFRYNHPILGTYTQLRVWNPRTMWTIKAN